MALRVYRYGCKVPTYKQRQLIESQLLLAFKYRLMLWNLALAGRELYRQQRREAFPELEATEKELERQVELMALVEDKKQKQPFKVEMQRLKAKLYELRKVAKEDADFKITTELTKDREMQLRRAIRGCFSQQGLYSGTYLLVEDADKRSRLGKNDPARPRFDGTGALCIQLQGGESRATIYGGKHPSIAIVRPPWFSDREAWQRGDSRLHSISIGKPGANRIRDGRRTGCRTNIRYRVMSAERKPVCIDLQAMVHRELPADAKVTWAKLVVQRTGVRVNGHPRMTYSVQLTTESETHVRTEFGGGEVAICFSNDVVAFSGDHEPTQTFTTPEPFKKLDDLQSIRDKERNGVLGLIRAWTERVDELPDWLLHAIDANAEKSSCRRAVRLVFRIKDEARAGKLDFPEVLMTRLLAWVRQENHLYRWQFDGRSHFLRARKEAYRKWAAELRRKYRTVILDDRTLATPALKTQERNVRGLNELRLTIKHSFGPEDVIDLSGKNCAEMFEQYHAQKVGAAE